MNWKDQFNAVRSNVFDFAERVKTELTAENELDPSTELQYHKDQAIKFERDLIKCQSELKEKNSEVEALTESVREAFEEVELTRQTLLNRLAAKELELEKAQHQLEQLRDFQHEPSSADENNEQLALELDLVRAEKANLSDELTALNNKLQYYQEQLATKSEPQAESLRPQEVELLHEELTKSNNRIESLRQEMSNLLEKNHLLLNECTQRQELCQHLEHQLSAIQAKNLSAQSSEIEKLRAQIGQLQGENDRLRQEFSQSANDEAMEQLKEENDRLRRELLSSESANEDLKIGKTHKAEIKKLEDEINRLVSLSKNSSNLLETIEQLTTKNAELSNRLESEINEGSRPICSLDNRIKQLIADIGIDFEEQDLSDDEALGLLEEEFWRLKSVIDDKEQQINDQGAQLQQLVQQATEIPPVQEDGLIEKLTIAKERISELESRVEQSERISQQLQLGESGDKKKIEELNRYVENLKEEANLLRHENVSCIHDFNALREDNERLKITLSEYEKRLNESFAERDQIIREASEELLKAKSRILELESEAERSNNLTQQFSEKGEADKQKFEALNSLLNQLKEETELLRNERSESIQQIEALKVEIGGLRTSLIESETSLNEAMSERSNFVHEASMELSNTQLRIQELEATVGSQREVMQRLKEAEKTDKMALDELNLSINQLDREVETLRHENSSSTKSIQLLKEENERLRGALAESENSLNEMMTERKSLVEETDQAEIYRRYTQDRIERKQKELDDANAKIQQIENNVDCYRVKLEKQQNENDSLHRRINGINLTIKELQSAYAESQTELRLSKQASGRKEQDLQEKFRQLRTEMDEMKKDYNDVVEKLKSSESQVSDLRAEVELLEERCQNEAISSARNALSNSPSTSNSIATFVMPPELRQFILSAITCDEQQRLDGAMLLASLIGCSQEEKSKVEQSHKPSGWGSIFRSPQQSRSSHPQNTREFLTQFVEFLERESTASNASAAIIERTEPVRIEHDFQPQNHTAVDKDLPSVIANEDVDSA